MSLFKPQKNNVESVVNALLKHLKVNVTSETVSNCLKDHPNYPSLISVDDCLTEWYVANQTFKLSNEFYQPDKFDYPFLAKLKDNDGHLIIVYSIKNGLVSYADESHKEATMSETEFLKRWEGSVLSAEANELSGEKNYQQNRIKGFLQNMILPLGLTLILATFYFALASQNFTWPLLTLSCIKLAGLGVSVLLLIQSINSNNPFIQNLCGLAGKNNCNAILNSDAAKVTPWLSWSEVGFFYFAGSLLALLLVPSSLFLLAWLNLLALPYTVYSITYQYKNKNWCVLCCAVQVLLVLEFLIFAFGFGFSALFFSPSTFQPSTFYLILIAFLTPITTWAFLKPFFLSAVQIKPVKQQLKSFKYNTDLFTQALTNQTRYSIDDELMPITLGNPEAEIIITMVSNPFCAPCGVAHQTLDELLQTRDDIQLKTIFTATNNDNDPRTKVTQHLSALSLVAENTIVENALNDWYKQANKNYQDWASQYPVIFNGEMKNITEKQSKWCDMAEITHTPTILINGYKLPKPYTVNDIKYLIN